MRISQRAFDLIVELENSNRRTYEASCTGFEWPGLSSGPTVGIGYDCGMVTSTELLHDWTGIVPKDTLDILLQAVRMKGSPAHEWVRAHRHDVHISWEQALREFSEREVPKWENRTAAALPNTNLLSGDSFGALVSLAYNRGADKFHNTHPRFTEMVAIRTLMQARQFVDIPAEIRSMQRLWATSNGVWKRRESEARLFELGLGLSLPGVEASAAKPQGEV